MLKRETYRTFSGYVAAGEVSENVYRTGEARISNIRVSGYISIKKLVRKQAFFVYFFLFLKKSCILSLFVVL